MSSVIIVSGLPRSGTSMMMRALEAGGVPVLTDKIRKADKDNPKGYYEFELAKKVKEDSSWLKQAQEKAVKMVYKLLYFLPKKDDYQVIFMQRNLEEVLLSQNKMLKHKGEQIKTDDQEMIQLFEKELKEFEEWINKQKNFSFLKVNYKAVIEQPKEEFERIKHFLKRELDIGAMIKTVDPELYRNRKN